MKIFPLVALTTVFWVGGMATLSAEGDSPHPMVDFKRGLPQEPLREMNSAELESRRDAYLAQIDDSGASTEHLEAQLLQTLLDYDDERIRIVDLIPELIELYEVDPNLAEDMMNFRATLSGIVKELRPNIHNLQSYKPYDFRIGFSFAALMSVMQSHQEVSNRMYQDQGNPETRLGQYYLQLQSHYQKVEEARAQLERGYQVEDLKERVELIDAELRRRQAS